MLQGKLSVAEHAAVVSQRGFASQQMQFCFQNEQRLLVTSACQGG
jgi:hypothetical protein